ncbi:MAG TPA: peptidoglycan glycosyltransferase [Ruminiclostridium sp.]|jgi:peptidoglycan glycosyltransferase/penicillin-binding protein 2|uniref:Peptidoglycan glycosyltransferase n=1 Tax=Acetivibrio saccincola TaxID=1677857 RepID=A0A2S8RBK5_9FIRM|nr:penicillin-binding transpeptidase domain-containing protein [Acetivibrio saccincola]NLW26157.1 peptidoglycan glycosyltransferase [Acetivibrio saccincola]PQQ67187.1 peptidoglycan glycosyltransferase [Acetivibrio saccincola]HAA43611.1 peptidoglycan glycosyltransferase [Ruminiclostridium sp.]
MIKKRLYILLFFFSVSIISLIIRFFYIQVQVGERLAVSATSQRISSLDIKSHRGNILDTNSIPFTNRVNEVFVVIKPLNLKGNEKAIKKIANILNVNPGELKRLVDFKKEPIIYMTDNNTKTILIKERLPGISFINSLKRHDNSGIAKHVTGYLNKADGIGQTGIEKSYDQVLNLNSKSSIGMVTYPSDNFLAGLGYRFLNPVNYKKLHVKLTLNYHIQKIAENALDKRNLKGAVVIQNVLNGDVVAMVSKPDFDPDKIDEYLDSPDKELFNRAVASYNLGSIFKTIVLASAYLDNKTPPSNFYCPGYLMLGDKEFKCSSYASGGHGFVDVKKAFASSCNSYFIELGINTGIENILETAKKFFTGINVQGIEESNGHLPQPGKYYTHGDIANISIGQGDILATPLQVSNIIATIANGGIKNTVNIVDCIVDSDGNIVKKIKKEEGERILPKEICDNIKSYMEEVTISGTGTKANLDAYGGAGGKTGSAETGQVIDGERVVHAWFAGYFPKANPKYSIVVFIEDGKSGGDVAAPVFKEIAKEICEKNL